MDKEFRESVDALLQSAFQQAFARGDFEGNPVDMGLLSQLCIMTVQPTGREKPRELIRQLSDKIIEQIVTKTNQLRENPMLGPICQMCVVEWSFRNNYLNEDWLWQWDGNTGGSLAYSSKIPLDQIPVPTGN